MAVDLSEALGLIAYYQSQSLDGKNISDLVLYRKEVLSDFKKSKLDKNIKYLLWIMSDYPKYLTKIVLKADNKKDVNKTEDLKALKKSKNKFIKKYIKSKLYDVDFDVEELSPSNDSEEIMQFLIQFDQDYENQVLNKIR